MSLVPVLRNVFSNYALVAVTGLTGFVLTPLLFHSLRPTNYAILTFALATVAVWEALDVGLSSALIRFVSDLSARGLHAEARRLGSTVFYLLLGMGLLGTGLLAGLSPLLAGFFHLRGTNTGTTSFVIGLIGLSAAFQLPSAGLRGYLVGCQNFHLISAVDMASQLLRAIGIVLFLQLGWGLTELAGVFPATALFRLAGLLWIARRTQPSFWPHWTEVNLGSLRKVLSFSSLSFLEDTATQWFFQLDTFLAARLLSLPQLAILAVARRFPMALQQLSHQALMVATPMISADQARGKQRTLKKYVLLSTRNLLALVLPSAAALFVWAEVILRLWVGEEVLAGARVFRIFLIFAIFAGLQEVPLALVYGVGQLQFSAGLSVLMLAAGAGLGAWACSRSGLEGLAVAYAAIQMVATLLLYWQALRLAELDLRQWFKKAVAPVILAALPTVGWFFISYSLVLHTLGAMVISVLVGFVLFLGLAARLITGSPRQTWQTRIRRLLLEID